MLKPFPISHPESVPKIDNDTTPCYQIIIPVKSSVKIFVDKSVFPFLVLILPHRAITVIEGGRNCQKRFNSDELALFL